MPYHDVFLHHSGHLWSSFGSSRLFRFLRYCPPAENQFRNGEQVLVQPKGRWQVASSRRPDASGAIANSDNNTSLATLFWQIWEKEGYQLPEEPVICRNTNRASSGNPSSGNPKIPNTNRTYLFELTSEKHPIVVRYTGDKLTLIGARDMDSLQELDPVEIAGAMNWRAPTEIEIAGLKGERDEGQKNGDRKFGNQSNSQSPLTLKEEINSNTIKNQIQDSDKSPEPLLTRDNYHKNVLERDLTKESIITAAAAKLDNSAALTHEGFVVVVRDVKNSGNYIRVKVKHQEYVKAAWMYPLCGRDKKINEEHCLTVIIMGGYHEFSGYCPGQAELMAKTLEKWEIGLEGVNTIYGVLMGEQRLRRKRLLERYTETGEVRDMGMMEPIGNTNGIEEAKVRLQVSENVKDGPEEQKVDEIMQNLMQKMFEEENDESDESQEEGLKVENLKLNINDIVEEGTDRQMQIPMELGYTTYDTRKLHTEQQPKEEQIAEQQPKESHSDNNIREEQTIHKLTKEAEAKIENILKKHFARGVKDLLGLDKKSRNKKKATNLLAGLFFEMRKNGETTVSGVSLAEWVQGIYNRNHQKQFGLVCKLVLGEGELEEARDRDPNWCRIFSSLSRNRQLREIEKKAIEKKTIDN
jgi:hypothetical protein